MAVEATLPGGSSAQGQRPAAYEDWRKILLQSASEMNSVSDSGSVDEFCNFPAVFCILNRNNKLLEFTAALICTFYWRLGSKGS